MRNTADRVNEEVRVALTRQRRTQEWLAGQIGMSAPSLSRRLANARSFRLDELERVAAALDVPLSTLLAEPEAAAS